MERSYGRIAMNTNRGRAIWMCGALIFAIAVTAIMTKGRRRAKRNGGSLMTITRSRCFASSNEGF